MRPWMVLLALTALSACAPMEQRPDGDDRVGEPPAGWVSGVVFDDRNLDGRHQPDEPGVGGVRVSNGLDVTLTGIDGTYRLLGLDDMNLTVVQPSGWRVAVDALQRPQFFTIYKRGGSPDLRYGGLDETRAPWRVDFPLYPRPGGSAFRCVFIGDSQTYSNDEIGYFRDSAVAALLEMELDEGDCLIYLGDVVGDDLDLLDRLLANGAVIGRPQWLVHGNHDMDLDAPEPAHSADSWRARAMPDYYAFEIGEVVFVALNNIVFPCGAEDATVAGREFCIEDPLPRYNGRLPRRQLIWLGNLLATLPQDRLVVLLHHIPLVSFSDAQSAVHQTDNATEIHALLAGRPALSVAGHTHSLEHLAPGEWYAGWPELTGVEALPFRHLIAGAASGSWWLGDLELNGVPMAIQRMGSPRGLLSLEFAGAEYLESYHPTGFGAGQTQWLSFNTPAFRAWHQTIAEWMEQPAELRDPVPPRSINDLPDLNLFTRQDLTAGVYLTANVWLGSTETRVTARIDDQPLRVMERVQQGQGEAARVGPAFVDPLSARRLLSSSRQALVSRSGNPRAQGYEGFQGVSFRAPPGPQGRQAPDRNLHLWRLRLPDELGLGVHVAVVSSTDRHGRVQTDRVTFEVVDTLPPRRWAGAGW